MGKAFGLVLGFMVAAGCGDDPVYVMSEIYELEGDERIFSGGGCAIGIVDDGSVGGQLGGDDNDDFVVTERGGSERFTVVVTSGDSEIEVREYTKAQLLSGEEDRFVVETLAGRRYELAYWGGRDCDTSHLPEEE